MLAGLALRHCGSFDHEAASEQLRFPKRDDITPTAGYLPERELIMEAARAPWPLGPTPTVNRLPHIQAVLDVVVGRRTRR